MPIPELPRVQLVMRHHGRPWSSWVDEVVVWHTDVDATDSIIMCGGVPIPSPELHVVRVRVRPDMHVVQGGLSNDFRAFRPHEIDHLSPPRP